MKLVNADFASEEEKAVQQIFKDNPGMLYHVARLLNSYRELVEGCLGLDNGERMDSSDVVRSCAKNENSMRRLGIPILETLEDWAKLREMRDASRQD